MRAREAECRMRDLVRDAGWSWWPSSYSHAHVQPTGHGLLSLGARQELVLAVLADDSLQLVTWTGKVMRVVGNKTREVPSQSPVLALAMNGAPAPCPKHPHHHDSFALLCVIPGCTSAHTILLAILTS
jgi:hypothetical protein